ncbi:MAG TPA: site-specific DNA-methyltransferase [Solirubrobacteraceae bacterium]|nr:site-specific DNA-methyltransferase [Solirubrobacteraceae bacterium]
MPGEENNARLSVDEIEIIAERLRRGEYLEEYLRPLLFRQAKEYELAYAAKDPKSLVLAETMGVPFQPLKRFGHADGDWTNKLIFGDNLQVLKTLLEMKNRGELQNADGTNGVRLAYIDPPFASKQEFRSTRGARAYRDKIAGAAFVEFIRKRLIFLHELLTEDGAMYVHLDTRKSHYIKVILDELFGEHNFRAEIVWKRTSAHSSAGRHGPVHDSILFYSKSRHYKWNQLYQPYDEEYLEVFFDQTDSDGRRWKRTDLTGSGRRRGETGDPWRGIDVDAKGRHWAVPPSELDNLDAAGNVHWPKKEDGMPRRKDYPEDLPGMALQDVWNDIRPMHNLSRDRLGYPTQKPPALLDRIIRTSTDEGDLVLDCFSGSGTTAEVAERLGRRWIVNDVGKLAIYITQRRLLSMVEGKGRRTKTIEPKPFELCSAGLYDNALVDKLSFGGFKEFCLELFGCREQPHTIGGVHMAGTRKGDSVHFFPFQDAPDMEMGRAYIESLHGRLKGKVTGSVYVVVPVASCDPGLFEDVVTVDKVTFFILRVPYSVIEVLHGRRFKLPDQPFSENLVNDPMDTFGFDFMQLPEADARYVTNGAKLYGVVRSFMRGGLDPDDFDGLEEKGRLDLAMVMVDRNYDGETFKVSDYFFGDEVEEEGWTFSLPTKTLGERMLVIYLDTHGNELRETVDIAKVKAGAKPRIPRRKKQSEEPTAEDAELIETVT